MNDDADLRVRIAVLETEHQHMREIIASMSADVKAIRDVVTQVRGGWRVLVGVGALAGAIGAAIMKFATMYKW